MKIHNPFKKIYYTILGLIKKLNSMLQKLGKVNVHNTFNIKGQKNAAKILETSIKTLQIRIKEGVVLKNNKHYQVNDTGRYSFNEAALLSVKGLI